MDPLIDCVLRVDHVWRYAAGLHAPTVQSSCWNTVAQGGGRVGVRGFARFVGAPLTAAALLLSGCATQPGEPNDPLEVPNRFMFAINQTVDLLVIRPVSVTYRDWAPAPVQRGVTNVLNNLGEPVTAINEAAQGEPERAAKTVARFFVNSTVGLLGIFDVAKTMGLQPTKEDFGQTLAVWSKNPEDGGPYLVLPLVGPSNARDAVGLLVDNLIDPFTIAGRKLNVEYLLYARTVMAGIDARTRTMQALDDLEKNSLDFYAAVRSAYTQRRISMIRTKGDPGAATSAVVDAATRVALVR
jgi:phospholipid-binding lipoprotein MlaA